MPSFRFFSRQDEKVSADSCLPTTSPSSPPHVIYHEKPFTASLVSQDGVFRMSLSPDGTLLAVIHFSGRLSLWDVPSLRQRAAWGQDQQVNQPVCMCIHM